ncbi:MAG: MBL fold metallo-hydrolase [Maribacter sp.]|nr:MBL fold metallo-hydrolase [Maribacter sp.]
MTIASLIHFSAVAQEVPQLMGITLTNVYDAFGKEKDGLVQDFGFSCLVEYGDLTVLFDSGTNAKIFEQNIKLLNIDLKKVDIAIVSHGHYDHIGGFDYLIALNPNVKIYLPNDFFSLGAPIKFPFREAEPEVGKTLPKEEQYFGGDKVIEGMITVPTGRFWKSNFEYLTEAKEVAPGLTIVPTTSKLMGTYIKYPPFSEEHPQFIGMPELSASFATKKGAILISGCSHSTIESIIQEDEKIQNGKIYLVLGGFHLIPYSRDYIEGLALRMRDVYHVESVAPAHCTGQLGFSIFKNVFGSNDRFFGLGETLKL